MLEQADLATMLEDVSPMFWKKGRLETFEHWPFKSEKNMCNPENMAAAGFFAVGGTDEPDLAECYMCHKQLDGWEPVDDPWEEHKKHQPDCIFIKLDKHNEESMTLKDMFELMHQYTKSKKSKEFEKIVETVKKNWKDSATTIPNLYDTMKRSQKSLE